MTPLLTFAPGPSKISQETKEDVTRAITDGICEISHRSQQFRDISTDAVEGLRTFLEIPNEYGVYFTASATEAMDILVRNAVDKTTCHFTCGSFSDVFFETAFYLWKDANKQDVPWGDKNDYSQKCAGNPELITITMNETSTGVMCSQEDIALARKNHPDALIAVDITSMAAMKKLSIGDADAWLFSVQKGFGLPAGMGVLIVNDRVHGRAQELEASKINQAGIYTFTEYKRNADKGNETICTPNVLSIYLLSKQVQRWNNRGGIEQKERETIQKSSVLYQALDSSKRFRVFPSDNASRSHTVVCGTGDPAAIQQLHSKANAAGMQIGSGYGRLRETTFRIACFPAVTQSDVERVLPLLG